MKSVFTALVLLVAFFAMSGNSLKVADLKDNATFKVCGYYCGPNWCSNEVISEQQCVATGVWGIASAPGNCADSCCRIHDDCCGEGTNRPACNDAIVQCIETNECYWSVCGALVWAAMKTVSDWCCGSPCPTYYEPTAAAPLPTVSGKQFCDASSGLRLTFDDTAAMVVVGSDVAGECAQRFVYQYNETSLAVSVAYSDACASKVTLPRKMTYLPHAKKMVSHAAGKYQELELC